MAKFKYKVVKPNQIVFEKGQPRRLLVGEVYETDNAVKGDRVELISETGGKKLEAATPKAAKPETAKPAGDGK
ncbi:MAG: hypothetical protein VW258_11490 [Thalassolituus sp.]